VSGKKLEQPWLKQTFGCNITFELPQAILKFYWAFLYRCYFKIFTREQALDLRTRHIEVSRQQPENDTECTGPLLKLSSRLLLVGKLQQHERFHQLKPKQQIRIGKGHVCLSSRCSLRCKLRCGITTECHSTRERLRHRTLSCHFGSKVWWKKAFRARLNSTPFWS